MRKLLVVEDETNARNGICMLVEKSGLNCRVVGTAEDGYEGLEKTKLFAPDIIVTDIRMPRMDGLVMIERIRSWNMPVHCIVLSGYPEFKYAQKALKFGVMDYLLKPITKEDFLDALLGVMDRLERPAEAAPAEQDGDSSAGYPAIVLDAMRCIKENYGRQITLDEIAHSMKVTPEYLSSVFSKTVGRTFVTYLRDTRIARAKSLLLTTELRIFEIAYQVGYNDVSYFCKVFKQCAGISARAFMQKRSMAANTPPSPAGYWERPPGFL